MSTLVQGVYKLERRWRRNGRCTQSAAASGFSHAARPPLTSTLPYRITAYTYVRGASPAPLLSAGRSVGQSFRNKYNRKRGESLVCAHRGPIKIVARPAVYFTRIYKCIIYYDKNIFKLFDLIRRLNGQFFAFILSPSMYLWYVVKLKSFYFWKTLISGTSSPFFTFVSLFTERRHSFNSSTKRWRYGRIQERKHNYFSSFVYYLWWQRGQKKKCFIFYFLMWNF